ncbi:MAG: hypothetical protein V3T31_00865, partial [candidate division Zixibacteria bacterium]
SSTTVALGAHGSAFGYNGTAITLGQGRGNFGGAVGIADATSFHGSFTYGLSTFMDWRFKLGMIDPGGGVDAELTFGTDLKWKLWDYVPNGKHPIDLALSFRFEYVSYDPFSVLQLGGGVVGSYPLSLSGGSTLTPYGRMGLRIESVNLDLPPGSSGDDSETSLKFGFNGGVAWALSGSTTVYGEFQLDGNDGIFLGLDFSIM